MKYIIEIEDQPFVQHCFLNGESAVYRAKGFKSLVFDECGLEKLKPFNDDACIDHLKFTGWMKRHDNMVIDCFGEENVKSIKESWDDGMRYGFQMAHRIAELEDSELIKAGIGLDYTSDDAESVITKYCVYKSGEQDGFD